MIDTDLPWSMNPSRLTFVQSKIQYSNTSLLTDFHLQ